MTGRPTDPPAAGNPPDRRQALLAELHRERFGDPRTLELERHRKPDDKPATVQQRRAKLQENT